ncbi:MAG: bifunctional riboflavin kinase/FAD synthetase [Gemmatimonadetes bacterium]|nr:bifunctional riboflavin kinase/FAD synthetase [Gemmatimonadota bacterium]
MTDPIVPPPLRGLPLDDRGAVVTVGSFDGVHRGHQDVLRRLVERAATVGLPSVVVTFEPHPLEVVNPAAAPPRLTLRTEKLEQLAATGVSYVVVLPFTPTLAACEADTFVRDILLRRLGMAELFVGHDHGFGRGRLGDIEALRALGGRWGFGVTVLDPVRTPQGVAISSTGIRRAVAGGDLARAGLALGRPYSVAGLVVRGDRRGRTLGYPTLNVPLPTPRKLLPPDGVYAVIVQMPSGPVGGMCNLGGRPTVGDGTRLLEAHCFDAAGDWYGAPVRIDFLARIRDVRAFPSLEALRAQLDEDAASARALLGTDRGGGLATATWSTPLG